MKTLHTPNYWKTFYTVQALLLEELPEKYPVPESSYDSSPINDKAHVIAKLIHSNYEEI